MKVLCAALLLSTVLVHATTFYVKTNGDDNLSGANWTLAKHSITNTMAAATSGDQIWVARGTYTQLVTVKPGVALYGGFIGTETAPAQRNWLANPSILNGASLGSVVSITNGGPDTRVDGWVITGGAGLFGGGINIVTAGPVIANNFIYGNSANGGVGGGIYIAGFQTVPPAQPILTNNVIYQNIALGGNGEGAGITVRGSSPLLAWNQVFGNVADYIGGGIACFKDCHSLIVNNIVEGNIAGFDSTQAGSFGGGIMATAADIDGQPVPFAVSAPIIANNIIAANGAPTGGGVQLADSQLGAATLVNNTIVANTGSGLAWGNTSPTNYNNLIAFNSSGLERADSNVVTFHNNDVYGNAVLGQNTDYVGITNGTGILGNISADPMLANFRIGDFRLQPNSPCVDAGLTTAVVAGWPDIGGSNRISGATVDIGAYESTGASFNVPTPVVHVSSNGNDRNDGLSWATAKRTVQAGITATAPSVKLGGELWVEEGTYTQHVSIPAFVYVYGGFAGTETNRAARNVAAHPTILDGGGQPTVVTSWGAGYLVSALDGFTVRNGGVFTGGQSPTGLWPNGLGGGIQCKVSAPFIANNLIESNSVGNPYGSSGTALGGGLYLYLAHAQVTGNTFTLNDVLDYTAGSGGAIYCLQAKPTIAGNFFMQNHAKYGPAIGADVCSARLTANTFITNFMYSTLPSDPTYQAAVDGAILFTGCNHFWIEGNWLQGNWANFGGGIDLKASWDGEVRNNVVFANLAYDPSSQIGWGGGIFCQIDGQNVPISIVNNTIVGNAAPGPFGTDQGGGISLDLAANSLVLANNIVAFNSGGIYQYPSQAGPAVFLNNCVTNQINYTSLAPGVGDLHVDPQLVNPAGADFHLRPASPCIDAGVVTNAPTVDYDQVPRPLDGKNDGRPAFDIGAFEFVNPNADTDHDGMPDQAELIAGTNPTDPTSFLKLQSQLSLGDNAVLLSWLSVTGRTYTVQFSSGLPGGSWQTLTNNLQGTGLLFTGAPLQVLDPIGADASRFYRLSVSKN